MDGPPRQIRYPVETPPEGGEAIEIAEGILWIRIPLPMVLNHVNVYALDDGDGWTIVDTGLDTRKTRAVWESVLAGPLGGKPVRRLIVTHHHPDHVGLAGWFAARGAETWATRTAWLMARMLTLDVQDAATPQALDFLRRAGVPRPIFDRRAAERPFNFADIVHPIPPGFHRIAAGDTVAAGGRRWAVHVGHGHAPEHATLWSLDDDLVLTGDQVLPGISPNLGVYPTEPGADTVGEWLESCTALSRLAEPRHLALPGHKLPFRGLPQRLGQLIGNHHGALDRLVRHLSQPRTAHDCFQPLFLREIGAGEYGLALAETVGHLNHLLRTGRATREARADDAWLWRATGD